MAIIHEAVNKEIHISMGNTKMGRIPSVSLPPIKTCANCSQCAKKCYANKSYRMYPSVKNAYDENLEIATADLFNYFSQINDFLNSQSVIYKMFRWHVSGDILNYDYFVEMAKLAKDNPFTTFLCFTKNYSVVNDFISTNGPLPENLKIVFSNWFPFTCDNPHNLPTGNVRIDENTPIPDEAKNAPVTVKSAECAFHLRMAKVFTLISTK